MALQQDIDYIFSPKVRDTSSTVESIFIGTKDWIFSFPSSIDYHKWKTSAMSGTVTTEYVLNEGLSSLDYFSQLLKREDLTLDGLRTMLEEESSKHSESKFLRIEDFKKFHVKMGFLSNTVYLAKTILDSHTFNGFPKELKPKVKAFYEK